MDSTMMFNNTGFVGNHKEWGLETLIDPYEMKEWVGDRMSFGLACGVLYLGAVFSGQKYMEKQSKYNLRNSMMIWSLLLAIFSIIGTTRLGIVMYHVAKTQGFHGLICSDIIYLSPISKFWGIVFVFSKFLEYVDTAFIILRKQKLIFLHWYHHLTVSLYSWWCYGSHCAGGPIFTFVNFLIHSMMYTYYAVRAAGIKVPRPIAIIITASQIVQMVIGSFSVYYVYVWGSEKLCKTSFEHVFYSGSMYGSYFLLFIHFFYQAYLKKRPDRKPKEASESPQNKKQENVTSLNGHVANGNGAIFMNGKGSSDANKLRERRPNATKNKNLS